MKQFRTMLPFFVLCAVLAPLAINNFATCTGASPCRACKNCKHCAKDGGTCGICA